MSFSVTATLPIGFSSLFLLVELYIRYIDSRGQNVLCLSHRRYIIINFVFWLCCVIFSVVALKTELEAVSVLSFQLVWMQAAVLKIYHLRKLLFHAGETSQPYGILGLTCTACLQCVAAGLCIWDAARGSTPHWVRSALVPILHVGWGFFYTVLLLWITWICSVHGRRSKYLRTCRVCCRLLVPLLISAILGAIPLSLWYRPKTAFLIFCAVQSLLYTITVVSAAVTKAIDPQLGSHSSCNTSRPLQDEIKGESTHASTLTSYKGDFGAAGGKHEVNY